MDSRTRQWLAGVSVLLVASGALLVYALVRPTGDARLQANTAPDTLTFGKTESGSIHRPSRSKSARPAQPEPTEEVKAWLAKLESAIRDGDRHRVEVVVYEGREFLGFALPLVERLLDECETPQRLLCVLVLGRMKDGDSLDVLRSLLVPPEDPAVKVAVIEALVERHDVEWGEKVLAFYLEPNETRDVRLAAIKAMETIGNSTFAKRILKMFLADTDQELKVAALNALGKLKNKEVVRDLLEASKTEGFKKGLRLQLIRILGEIGSEEALEFLKENAARNDDVYLRKEAIMALCGIATKAAKDALADLANNSEDKQIRYDAYHNLASLPGDEARDALVSGIERHWADKDLRDLCAQGLFYQNDVESAKKAVEAMARDPEMNGEYFSRINKQGNTKPEVIDTIDSRYRELAADQRKGFVDALGGVTGDAAEAARRTLRTRLDTEENLDVQRQLMYSLAKQKDATCVPQLQRVFQTSTDYDVRDAAIESAQYLDGAAVESFLESIVQNNGENEGLRMAAQGALNEVRKRK